MLQHPNIWPVQYKTVSPDRLHSIVDCDPTAWRVEHDRLVREAAERDLHGLQVATAVLGFAVLALGIFMWGVL